MPEIPAVVCPDCGAAPGRPCVRPDGSQWYRCHRARYVAAGLVVPAHGGGNRKLPPLAVLRSLFADGWTQARIARRYGVHPSSLSKYMKEQS